MEFRVKALARMRAPDEIDTPTTLASPARLDRRAGRRDHDRRRRRVGVRRPPADHDRRERAAQPSAGHLGAAEPGRWHGHRRPGRAGSEGQRRPDRGRDPVRPAGTAGREPVRGLVVGVAATAGQIVGAGSTVLTVERIDGTDGQMVALLFVPRPRRPSSRRHEADSVSSAPSAAFGLLEGRVAAVSQYPLDPASLSNLLGGDSALSGYASAGRAVAGHGRPHAAGRSRPASPGPAPKARPRRSTR